MPTLTLLKKETKLILRLKTMPTLHLLRIKSRKIKSRGIIQFKNLT